MSQDTASRRAATGLDAGARSLLLAVANETAGLTANQVVGALFHDRYGSADDYYAAVAEVHGANVAYDLNQIAGDAQMEATRGIAYPGVTQAGAEAGARALLLNMPEEDFRLALEEALRILAKMRSAAARISAVCASRGAPWIFDREAGFQWVGDAEVQQSLVEPALSALQDRRFSGGVRSEFESARAELRSGTPQALKQAIHEAGCSVESAMKVVLDEHRITYPQRDAAQKLFDHLVRAGIVPRRLERLVLAAATPRNQTAGHGAGAVAHNPDPAEAESVVAAAAGAIAYLHGRLP